MTHIDYLTLNVSLIGLSNINQMKTQFLYNLFIYTLTGKLLE